MWCKSCRQEVPGLVDELDGRYACPRCGAVLLSDAGLDLTVPQSAGQQSFEFADVSADSSTNFAARPKSSSSGDSALPVFEPARPPQTEPARVTTLRWDAANWELNEKLRHVERVTASSRYRIDAAAPTSSPPAPPAWEHAARGAATAPPTSPTTAIPVSRPIATPSYIAPNAYAAPPYPTNPFAPAPYPPPPPPPDHHHYNRGSDGPARLFASLISWLFVGSAIIAFSCGGFLAAWGAIAGRLPLQQLGMPILLGGVALLVVGMLPQIFLRRSDEQAYHDDLDERSHYHAGPPRPHYAHDRATYRA